MTYLLLGVRTSLYDFKRIKLDNVNLDTKIANLKVDVSKKANIPKESLELVYCGNILSDEATLKASGIKPGVMVHVLKKKVKETTNPAPPMSEENIQALVLAIKALMLTTPSYKTYLQQLCRPESLDYIIMITPGLSQDPVAIAMIQDPELLLRMSDIETVRRIVKMHPALADAANHIVAAAQEEALFSNTNAPSTSTGIQQFRQFPFSDDEDMESSQSSDSAQPGVSRNQSFSAITPAQLAAALASASQHQGTSSSANSGGGVASGAGSGEASSAITPEMVSFAMQRAMAVMDPTPRNEETNVESSSERPANHDFTEQMRQMRELGLTDDVVNFQALQVAGGDVHAAIDLVFSGAISSEHH